MRHRPNRSEASSKAIAGSTLNLIGYAAALIVAELLRSLTIDRSAKGLRDRLRHRDGPPWLSTTLSASTLTEMKLPFCLRHFPAD
jgi:hypothetical protein